MFPERSGKYRKEQRCQFSGLQNLCHLIKFTFSTNEVIKV